jgi:hypothetical protein
MKYWIFFLSVLVAGVYSSDKRSGPRPFWLHAPPGGYVNDYYVGIGTSHQTIVEAKRMALIDAVKAIVEKEGITALTRMDVISTEKERRIQDYIKMASRELKIQGLEQVEAYWEKGNTGEYRYWLLVRLPKQTNLRNPPTVMAPVMRSVIVPGWGQFFKHEPRKGTFFFISTVISGGVSAMFMNMSNQSHEDAILARSTSLKDYYNDNSALYFNLSVACALGAGITYVFNVVDAAINTDKRIYP